jgi:hypothetical protein
MIKDSRPLRRPVEGDGDLSGGVFAEVFEEGLDEPEFKAVTALVA